MMGLCSPGVSSILASQAPNTSFGLAHAPADKAKSDGWRRIYKDGKMQVWSVIVRNGKSAQCHGHGHGVFI